MNRDVVGYVAFSLLMALGFVLATASDILTRSQRLGLVLFFATPLLLQLATYAVGALQRSTRPNPDPTD
jgi:hypothetical protein